jgi:hypothetical protein
MHPHFGYLAVVTLFQVEASTDEQVAPPESCSERWRFPLCSQLEPSLGWQPAAAHDYLGHWVRYLGHWVRAAGAFSSSGFVRRGFRNIRATLPPLASAPKPGKPGPGRPPGSKNRHPAPRHDVGKTTTRARSLKAKRERAG